MNSEYVCYKVRKYHDVYWGSHGCDMTEPHKFPTGCACDCSTDLHPDDVSNAGKWPHYGEGVTNYYGNDVGKDHT